MNNLCNNCGRNIQIMCRKGTGICGENCQKVAHKSQKRGNLNGRRSAS